MLSRLVRNTAFWFGVVFVLAGFGLMFVSEVPAAICCLLGIVLVIVGVAISSKEPEKFRSFIPPEKSNVLDLDAKKPSKVIDLDS